MRQKCIEQLALKLSIKFKNLLSSNNYEITWRNEDEDPPRWDCSIIHYQRVMVEVPANTSIEIPPLASSSTLFFSPINKIIFTIIRERELFLNYSPPSLVSLSLRRSLLSLEARVRRPQSPRIYQETRETFYSQQFPEILLSPDTRYFSLSLSRNFARVSRDGNFFHNAVIFPYSLVTLFNITGTNTTYRYVPYLFLRSSSRIIHLAHFFITMHRIKASLRDFSQW